MRPLIGITLDNAGNTASTGKYESPMTYSRAIDAAGGLPVLLPHRLDQVHAYLERIDGLLLTGGVDPRTEPFGVPTHPKARPMDPARQAFELALLDAAQHHTPTLPILGVCLGMQLMALRAGGALHQHLPDLLVNADLHRHDHRHTIVLRHHATLPTPGAGETVVSWHQQAVSNPGSLTRLATAPDGVIEAVADLDRPFYVGVQWHPERGGDGALSAGLLRQFVHLAASD